jgi:hypothetical protein
LCCQLFRMKNIFKFSTTNKIYQWFKVRSHSYFTERSWQCKQHYYKDIHTLPVKTVLYHTNFKSGNLYIIHFSNRIIIISANYKR